MELDDLKTAWREIDQKLETGRALHLRVLKEMKLDKTRSALRRLTGTPLVEILGGALVALLLGSFLADHLQMPRFAAPALMLLAFTVLNIAANVRQLVILGQIDYSAPVVTIQRELAELRALRIRATLCVLLLAPLLWTPLLIVGAQGLLGFDVYRVAPVWLAWNLAFGLAVIPLAIWVSRRFGGRFRGSRILRHLADDIAGRSLATALGHLEEIDRFEKES